MLQLAMSASGVCTAAVGCASAAATAAAAGGVLSSVPAHVCALLVCLLEHRASLLVPDCSTVIIALARASLNTLASSSLPANAVQRTALALARLLTRLPAALPTATTGPASHASASDQLSAALPALLHDYLHACKLSSHAADRQWQSVLQPAVASLLQAMSEHDISATHLMLPAAERELFKPVIAHYKREVRYRGQ